VSGDRSQYEIGYACLELYQSPFARSRFTLRTYRKLILGLADNRNAVADDEAFVRAKICFGLVDFKIFLRC